MDVILSNKDLFSELYLRLSPILAVLHADMDMESAYMHMLLNTHMHALFNYILGMARTCMQHL